MSKTANAGGGCDLSTATDTDVTPSPRPIRSGLTPAITDLRWDADNDAHLEAAYALSETIVEAAALFPYHSYDAIHKRLISRGIHQKGSTLAASTPAPEGSPEWLPCDPHTVIAEAPASFDRSLAEMCDEVERFGSVLKLHMRLPCSHIRSTRQMVADLGLVEDGDLVSGSKLEERLAYLREVADE